MPDYSRSRYVSQARSTVYGIDTALVIVLFASAAFWFAVGMVVWVLL